MSCRTRIVIVSFSQEFWGVFVVALNFLFKHHYKGKRSYIMPYEHLRETEPTCHFKIYEVIVIVPLTIQSQVGLLVALNLVMHVYILFLKFVYDHVNFNTPNNIYVDGNKNAQYFSFERKGMHLMTL
ncbi:hypothetical protein VPH35_050987 [Triticum aestivum]